jgi:hypothetical protein
MTSPIPLSKPLCATLITPVFNISLGQCAVVCAQAQRNIFKQMRTCLCSEHNIIQFIGIGVLVANKIVVAERRALTPKNFDFNGLAKIKWGQIPTVPKCSVEPGAYVVPTQTQG